MPHTQPAANPFALMMDPEAIFAAIEGSERLQRLKSRICRPLDEPRVAGSAEMKACDDESIESLDALAAAEPEVEAGEGSHPASSGACGASIAS